MELLAIRASSESGTISYLHAGEAEWPVVLLIHGLGWDAERLWREQIDPLVIGGWQVIAPDLRGVGQSSDITAPITISDYADDLEALLAELGISSLVLVGFSMGCCVAVDLASRHGLDLRGLVLACGGVRSSPEGQAGTEAMLDRAVSLGPQQFATEQADSIFGRSWAKANPGPVADFIRWRAAMDQQSLHHAFRATFGCNYEPALADIACPAAVITARDDSFVTAEAAARLAGLIPGAELEMIPDSGHMATVEQPELFNAALSRLLGRAAA
ncbi:alpha/beta fold hydrolase [Roseisalinus antarcticus]|uniref:Arylesterase n=1 Tax=Roseisalinus antarcticus TaxID=254357 RepID=A0A1Y5SJF3_9RHOB|nr:alpha/beta hydrolase [Roseisalinus antarcticus]SLN42228.1 Arylesterase [Roseisalinus antarcticus]